MTPSLRVRLISSATGLTVVFMLVLLPVLQNVLTQALEQITEQRLAADANTLISAAQIIDGQLQMPAQLPDEEFNLPGATLLGYIYDSAGKLVWRSGSTSEVEAVYHPRYDGGVTDFVKFTDNSGEEYYVYDVELHLNGDHSIPFSFITMLPSSELQPLLQAMHRQLYRWLGGGMLVLIFLLWLGLTWGFRSLRGLSRELDQVESGAIESLSDTHPRELLRLTRSLNRLLASERRQRERYRDSLSDLAHSLKTPLAVLQSVAENIRLVPANSEHARVLASQVERMSQQIDYQLQRASLRKSGLVQHRVKLLPLLELLSEALDKVYLDKQVVLHKSFANDFWVPMEKAALLELLGNLLENAYRLCLREVRVSARYRAKVCELLVEDDGPGVPAEQRQRIVRRGERLDTQHPGHGIGLSVAKDIIESYDGELSLHDSELGGAAFVVQLTVEGPLDNLASKASPA